MRKQTLAKILFFLPLIIFLSVVVFLWCLLLGKFLALFEGDIFKFLNFDWSPTTKSYGVLPMMLNSFIIATCSSILAFACALGLSLFLQDLGPKYLRLPLSFLIQAMSSIPPLIFGLSGALYIVPLVRIYSAASGYSLIATILTLSFFLVPFQTQLCSIAFANIQNYVSLTTEALGITPQQRLFWILIPQAKRALLASFALGFSRSLGDTLIALLVSGNSPKVPESIFSPIRVLTAHIALVASTDSFSKVFDSLFVATMLLLFMTASITLLSAKFLQARKVKA